MDTKTHSGKSFKRMAGQSVIKQILDWKPNVLIAVDDNAQSLVGVCFSDPHGVDRDTLGGSSEMKKLFGTCFDKHPNMVIVYSGIGAAPKDYGYRQDHNAIGILERMDQLALVDVFSIIAQQKQKPNLTVYAPIDNSTSGYYNLQSIQLLKKSLATLGITLTSEAISTFDDWKKGIINANQEADIILFSNYHTIQCNKNNKNNKNNKTKRVKPKDLIEWTLNNSTLPGIGAWGFFVEDGGMLSVGVSPFEQGEVAARLAIDSIQEQQRAKKENRKASLDGFKIHSTQQSTLSMRPDLLKKFDITLPHIYENFARATQNYRDSSPQQRSTTRQTEPCQDPLF